MSTNDNIRRRALLGATRNTDAHEYIVEYEYPRSVLTQQNYNPNTLSSKNITKVNWPEGITGIESYTFRGSSIDLNNVNEIPSTVTQIGKYAFANCINIQGDLVLPGNLEALGDYAFYYCSGITAVTLPSTDCAFGHNSLPSTTRDINATEGVTYMFAIYSISGLSNSGGWLYNQPNGNVYLGNNYIKYKGTMPSNTNLTLEDGTLSIAAEAFSSKSQLKSISIPDTVKFIGSSAFSGCTGLTSITIPKSLSYEVYEKIFSSQNSSYGESWPISSTGASFDRIISASWSSISPFYSTACTRITTVNWNAVNGYGGNSSSTQSIFLGGGTYLPNVTTINFGAEVESIPDYLCYGLKKLTSITIPSSVEYIGCYAFSNCTGLTSITIPETITELSYLILNGCTGITTINYNAIQSHRVNEHNGREVTTYNNIWGTTSNLTTINIGNQVQVIPKRFLGSAQSKVTSIIIPDSVTTIEQNGFEQSKLTNISLPSVTSIGTRAFYNCTSLTSVEFPSVISIEDYAFNGCSSLTSIDLPASVISIGNYAFYGCSSLTSVTIRATNPPTLSTYYSYYTFPSISQRYTIYVPASAVNTYKTTSKWSYWASRIQAIPS